MLHVLFGSSVGILSIATIGGAIAVIGFWIFYFIVKGRKNG